MMAVKLFEIPPDAPGVVVESRMLPRRHVDHAVAWPAPSPVGSSSVRLRSRACRAPAPGEKLAQPEFTGGLRGPVERCGRTSPARAIVASAPSARAGSPRPCRQHREPIVLLLLDVDYEASLHDCLRDLWPHQVQGGFLFFDEYAQLDLCALFVSETYWQRYFGGAIRPVSMDAGTGVGIGQLLLGTAVHRAAAPARSQHRIHLEGQQRPLDLLSRGAHTNKCLTSRRGARYGPASFTVDKGIVRMRNALLGTSSLASS